MAISAVSSIASQASAKASKGLADNFDTFLVLLTTQLKNQDPLSPMDSTEFTNQLVQFSSVEQEIQANKNLESLIALIGANTANSALGYLGREVVIESNQGNLSDGAARWSYEVAPDAASSAIVVKNDAGRIVYSQPGNTDKGMQEFIWDGKDANGIAQPDGVYNITVSALNKDANAVGTKVYAGGVVDSVESLGATPILTIGGIKASVDLVRSVAVPVARSTIPPGGSAEPAASTASDGS